MMKLVNKQNNKVVIYAPGFRKFKDKYYHPSIGFLRMEEWVLVKDEK